MPGIVGVIGAVDSSARKEFVRRMLNVMRHEDAYVDNLCDARECEACIGWIAHPDSFAHRASETSGNGLEIAFSGECFDTSATGRGPNNAHSLLDAYRLDGDAVLGEMNGLFSAALMDRASGQVKLFLDRYGSERIYYHITEDVLYFSSEAKALLAVLPKLRAFDTEGVAEFIAYGSCRGGRTLFQGISRLAGASFWVCESGRLVKQGAYFSPSAWEDLDSLSDLQFEEALVETARKVIPKYAFSNNDVGFSITGGLDTRMILACLTESTPKILCYTYGAEDSDTLDVRLGRKVAGHLGFSHETLRIGGRFVTNYSSYLDRSIFISDGCSTALNTHEMYFSELARAVAPTRLTGNFGSEILRSMSTLKPLTTVERVVNEEFKQKVDEAKNLPTPSGSLTSTVFEEIPGHLFGPMAVARSKLIFRTPYLDNALVELAYRAPTTSRKSPNASLKLVSTGKSGLGDIPTDLGYSCSGRSYRDGVIRAVSKITFKLDYWDKEGLPGSLRFLESLSPVLARLGVLNLHKFLPYRQWFMSDLHELVSSAARRVTSGCQNWWCPMEVAAVAERHASGKQNELQVINAILTLDAVERVLLDGKYDCMGSMNPLQKPLD